MSKSLIALMASGLVLTGPIAASASSHMDAPLITLDDAANTTDVYAFLSERGGRKYLTTALAVYPFEEPGIGPNSFRFDDAVRYTINVALDGNVGKGRSDLIYQFDFSTQYNRLDTILQAFLGPVQPDGTNQNLQQTYRVTQIDKTGNKTRTRVLGTGAADGLVVPPNNQGLTTALYNQGDDGDNPAKEGVDKAFKLDPYTKAGIANLRRRHQVFAGQRDDGFYADIQSIFDLDFSFGTGSGTPTKPFDSQGGFNVHTIVLDIPLSELDGADIAGVYATTGRNTSTKMPKPKTEETFPGKNAKFKQVGRQGNPLFAEALLPINRKDRYNQSSPTSDQALKKFAKNPELAQVFDVDELIPGLLRSIYIPDVIKVDLTTGPARLAGNDEFDPLSVFGGDTLKSSVQDPLNNGGFIPGGWPNGRRFGDDVVDIALIALGIAGPGPDFSSFPGDRVDQNDITYNDVFPYAATPHNGRNHPDQVLAP